MPDNTHPPCRKQHCQRLRVQRVGVAEKSDPPCKPAAEADPLCADGQQQLQKGNVDPSLLAEDVKHPDQAGRQHFCAKAGHLHQTLAWRSRPKGEEGAGG